MTWQEYRDQYIREGLKLGVPEEIISRNLDYAKILFKKNIPIIFDKRHLALLVGYTTSYIDRVFKYQSFFYRQFTIPKKNGKIRTISEPLPNLKEIQHWILDEILSKQKMSKYAKAYKKNHSVKSNAKFHLRQSKVLTIDIEDFFGNIDTSKILAVFKSFGYTSKVSTHLTNLCMLNGSLPQGAPTSPYLSNLITLEMDLEIGKFCELNKIRYTRYSDDLTFSGDFQTGFLLKRISEILTQYQFKIKESKTRLMERNNRQIVTGIVVNEKMQVSKDTRKKFRQAVYYIKTNGLDNHLEYIEEFRGNYLAHLIGIGNFILFVNPSDKVVQQNLSELRMLQLADE